MEPSAANPRHRRVPTRNQTGWSSNVLNELSEAFVQECSRQPATALDIGAALGVATLPALAAGATVFANDSDASHLEAIAQACPREHRDRLHLLPGRFPRHVDLPKDSLDAAHASNILHFLTGRQLELAAEKLHWWLKPGGRIFVLAATPYLKPFLSFVPSYEARVSRGDAFPGWVENTREVSTHRLLDRLPKSIHLLDVPVLTRVFEAAGFEIEQAAMFRRRDLPASLHTNGRESVKLVAKKS
jgi:SAM-dependent methyltransferase